MRRVTEKQYQISFTASAGREPDKWEFRAASRLCQFFSSDIDFLPSESTASPDLFVKRLHQIWEIKTINGNGRYTIQHAIDRSRRQSKNLIITLYATKMEPKKAIGRIKKALITRPYVKRLILITKSEKVVVIKGQV